MSAIVSNNVVDVFAKDRRQFYSTLFNTDVDFDSFALVSELDIVSSELDDVNEGVASVDSVTSNNVSLNYFKTYKDFLEFMVNLRSGQDAFSLCIFCSVFEPFVFHNLDELHCWFYNRFYPYVKSNNLCPREIVLSISKGSSFDISACIFKYVFFGIFRFESFLMMLGRYSLSKQELV